MSNPEFVPDPRLSTLSIKIADIDKMDEALQQAKNVLMHSHKGIEDFSFRTQENWSEGITQAISNARMSGGIISAISLLVGGIGIMNIMLASITERVREIGIRKAIGATFFDVFTQILVESVVIAIIGGLAGSAHFEHAREAARRHVAGATVVCRHIRLHEAVRIARQKRPGRCRAGR